MSHFLVVLVYRRRDHSERQHSVDVGLQRILIYSLQEQICLEVEMQAVRAESHSTPQNVCSTWNKRSETPLSMTRFISQEADYEQYEKKQVG